MNLRLLLSCLCFVFTLLIPAQAWEFNHIDFTKADQRALAHKGVKLDDLQGLVLSLTNGLETDAERFRSIYKWVCSNIKNDYGLYAKNKRKRKRYQDDSLKLEAWNDKFKKRIFKTLLKRKRTICTGYAYMVKTLSQLADIKCEIVNGFGKTSSGNIEDFKYPNHSWNAVKLNDKWYLCDPTWASGIQNTENGRFIFNYNDGLFLSSPKLFAINHFPIEEKWFLLNDNKPIFKEFLEAPIVYNDAYKFLESHISPQKLYNEVLRDFELKLEYILKPSIKPKDIVLLIDDGTSTKAVYPDKIDLNENQLKIYKVLRRKGFYDIHLKLDHKLVATYTFKVTNISRAKTLN